MIYPPQEKIENTITELYNDSKFDIFKMMKGVAKSVFRPMVPSDFKDAYLSISREQGEELKRLIVENDCKHIVEFGTSFGISTLFLAQGVLETGGRIITTELLPSKAQKAMENFKNAGVDHLVEVKVGDALDTLKDHSEPIDLLLLDGWKDLYLPIFQMLSSNFHSNTIIYVDNAEMAGSQAFLKTIGQDNKYQFQTKHQGKVVIISLS